MAAAAKKAPEWVKSKQCGLCNKAFNKLTVREHHCRACGGAFCGDCSPKEVPLPQFGLVAKQRVCIACYAQIYAEMKDSAARKTMATKIDGRARAGGTTPGGTPVTPTTPSSPTTPVPAPVNTKPTLIPITPSKAVAAQSASSGISAPIPVTPVKVAAATTPAATPATPETKTATTSAPTTPATATTTAAGTTTPAATPATASSTPAATTSTAASTTSTPAKVQPAAGGGMVLPPKNPVASTTPATPTPAKAAVTVTTPAGTTTPAASTTPAATTPAATPAAAGGEPGSPQQGLPLAGGLRSRRVQATGQIGAAAEAKRAPRFGDTVKIEQHPPAYWIKSLMDDKNGGTADQVYMLKRGLQSSRAKEQGKNVRADFIADKGLHALAHVLSKKQALQLIEVDVADQARLEVIGCLEGFVETEDFLTSLLSTPNLLPGVVFCLTSPSQKVKRKALELLTVTCWLRRAEGRSSVLDALHIPGSGLGKDNALVTLVKSLSPQKAGPVATGAPAKSAASLLDDTKDTDVQIAIMIFINALVNSAEDVEERIALRNRLLNNMGLGQALQYLSKYSWNRPELADLQSQLDTFDQGLTKDSKTAMYKAVDMSDPDQCWQYLKNSTREDGFATPLLEILHLLMTIPSEQTTGMAMWTTCQYILHVATMAPADGPDSDAPAKLTYDELRVMLKEKEELDLQQHGTRLRELEDQVEKQRRDLHASQVKASQVEDLMKKLEAANKEITALKDGLSPLPVGRLRSAGTVAIGADGAPSKNAPPPAKLAASSSAPFTNAATTSTTAPAKTELKGSESSGVAAPSGGADPAAVAAAMAEATAKHTHEITHIKKMLDAQAALSKQYEAENKKLHEELERAKAAVAAAAAGGGGGGAPLDAPPMAPPFDAPPTGAPDAPPFDAPPMAPPLSGGAPDAPPFEAPPMDGGIPPAPDFGGGIPPPPDFGGGIPPPPDFGGGAPPMAPPTGPQLKPKKKIKPNAPMRKFHWTLIANQVVPNSMWEKFGDDDIALDAADFEANFCSRAPVKRASVAEDKKQEEVVETKAKLVKLVDDKRSYNADISLARFRMSHEHLRDAVLDMDEKQLPVEKLGALIKIAPTPEEIELVKGYPNEASSLANTERFYLTVSNIPRLLVRLELWNFKQQYSNTLAGIQESLVAVEAALRELKSSEGLKIVFKIMLAFGNYMNGGTAKGQAYGFRLGALARLRQSKTADNSSNLLNYMIEYINKKQPKAADFMNQIGSTTAASRVENMSLGADIKKVCITIDKIANEVKSLSAGAPPGDKFPSVMGAFHSEANAVAKQLSQRFDKCEGDYKELLLYFGEDQEKGEMKWEAFFTIFATFITDYQTALDDINAKKEKEAKEVKRKEAEKAAADKRAKGGGAVAASGGAAVAGQALKLPERKEKRNSMMKNIYKSAAKGDFAGIIEAQAAAKAAANGGEAPKKALPFKPAGDKGLYKTMSKRQEIAAGLDSVGKK